jgi:phospholipase A1
MDKLTFNLLPALARRHFWRVLASTACLVAPGIVQAQTVTDAAQAPWQQCMHLTDDNAARLACFDRWAQQQTAPPFNAPPASASTLGPVAEETPAPATLSATSIDKGCRNPHQSELSRYWELDADSDCGTFGIRGYRPISLSLIGSDSVNTAPSTPAAGHTATATPYGETETRIQLSVRTKIAQGLLTRDSPVLRDSVWFGYTQQSYWQLFSGDISRPFRTTDHEPEIIYIYPTDAALPNGWRLRYSGISLNHQSNGQTLPLSRSWNRVILMAGMEKDDRFTLTGKIWQRLPENAGDDDNPDISDYIGRAELSGSWNVNRDNTLGFTLRHSLNDVTRGSLRLEWLKALGSGKDSNQRSGLRFHTQLFSGYGDSLVDYNRQRTVLSIGLSLVDW